MMASLDMTLCRRCGEPMAEVVSGGSLPRYLCRLCGDLDLAAPIPSVGPAALGDRSEFFLGSAEQVELTFDVIVRCSSWADTGRQPLHQPATRYSDQLPLHRTQLLQRHCA